MKKITIFSILWCLLLISAGNSETLETYADFIKESVLDYTEDIRETWRGAEMNQPPGGYLYRFYFDVTGDGIDELFLSSSLDSDRRYASWDVFKKDQQGSFKKVVKKIDFQPRGFSVDHTNGLLVIKNFQNWGGRSYLYLSYTFETNGSCIIQNRQFISNEVEILNNPDGQGRYRLGFTNWARANTEKILLGQFCRNSNIQWKKYDRNYTPDQQYLDSTDAKDIKSVENFTPQEAQQVVEEWKQKESATNNPSPKTSTIPSNQTQTNQVSQISLETKSSKQIIIWSIIAILGLGLIIIFVLKK